jgi:hypothetical protein
MEKVQGNAYTSDKDYQEFFGKPYTAIVFDWTLRRYVQCTMQAPRTPKDAVTPVDPDRHITHTPEDVAQGNPLAAWEACKQQAAERHQAIQAEICDYVAEHGPTKVRRLAQVTGKNEALLRDHLRGREGSVYVRIRLNGKDVRWGLVGQPE